MPTTNDQIDRVRRDRDLARGDVDTERREQRLEQTGERHAADEADDRRDDAHERRLRTARTGRPARASAPMARSRAISRPRWATMIEKVLKMMNEPTSSAMTPKTSRKVLKNPSASLTSFWLSRVICSPVSTSTFFWPVSDLLDVGDDLLLRDTRVRLDEDLVDLARFPEHPARGRAREQHRGRAEQAVRVAELRDARPACSRPARPCVTTGTVSPTLYFVLSAVFLSMTISSGARRAAPAHPGIR